MSDLLAAARQALEALQYHVAQTRPIHQTDAAITALRHAIEQEEQQEPVAGKPLPCPFCGANEGLTMTDGSTYRWGYAYCSNCGASAGETRRAYPDDGKWYQDAIQQWNKRATPPQRKPLIPVVHGSALSPSEEKWYVAGWREAEAAHGIGDKA